MRNCQSVLLALLVLLLTLTSNIQAFCPVANPFSGRTAGSSGHAAAAEPVFPTDNKARSVTGKELHELLAASTEHANSSKHNGRSGGLVVLFYLAGDPPSVAITPVFKCLAAFFPEEVQFVMVPYSELSLMALMSQGLHALPVLQVNVQGRRYRYSGKHWLGPMLQFVARALAQEPEASLDVAHFCSRQQQPPGLEQDLETCKLPSLVDVYTASRAGAIQAAAGRCDHQTMCRRVWECVRWDGEVTLEELKAQRPAPLLYISLVFLALRTVWMAQKWRKRAPVHAQVDVAAIAAAAPVQAGNTAATQQDSRGQPLEGDPAAGTGSTDPT